MVVKSRKKSRGHAISKVKRQNQKRTKLVKQGKIKMKRNKRASDIRRNPKKHHPVITPAPVEEEGSDAGEDMAGMVDAEDLDFIRRSVTQRSYSMLKRLRYKPMQVGVEGVEHDAPVTKQRRGVVNKQNEDHLEEQFEKLLDITREEHKPMRELLPIKTQDGGILRRRTPLALQPPPPVETEPTPAAQQEQELAEDSGDDEAPPRLELPPGPVSVAQLLAARQRQLARYRISIGALSSGVLEDPETKIGNLKKLLTLMSEPQPSEVSMTVPRLAAVSLLEVFRDLLPEYPVRHHEPGEGIKLSKDVKELRTKEQLLLSAYKQYLALLERMLQPLNPKNMKGKSNEERKSHERLALVALRCMGSLLEARPSFNFATNLARLLVPMLDHPSSTETRETVAASLGAVLKQDRRGDMSLEIARRVNALVKAREGTVRPEPVRLLLNLRLQDVDLDAERESNKKTRKLEARKFRMLAESKRERKRAKKLKHVEQELLETKAEESRMTRQKNFTEATKLAFTVFFRALKSDSPRPALLSATLEGLAKFAHCINIEVYGDLVRVLESLLNPRDAEESELPLSLRLQCVRTLLAVLSGHGQFLTIDPARFHAQLYRCLLPLCIGLKSQEAVTEALGPLATVLGAGRRKSISQQRLLAFLKRLGNVAINLEHHGALACLQLIRGALQVNHESEVLLETDTSGGRGIYLAELEEPEHCNAGSTALYELALLQRHYHPSTRSLAHYVAEGAPVTGSSHVTPDIDKLTAEKMYSEFNPREMVFKPTIPAPRQRPKQRLHFSYQNLCDSALHDQAVSALESDVSGQCDFWSDLCTVSNGQ